MKRRKDQEALDAPLPRRMTLDEIRAQAISRYRGRFQMEADEQQVRLIVSEILATRRPDWKHREEIQAWVEENLEAFGPAPLRFTDAQVEELRTAYQAALLKHALRHAEFIAAQHAQDLANAAIVPLLDAEEQA